MNHGQQTPGLQLQLDNNNPSLNNPARQSVLQLMTFVWLFLFGSLFHFLTAGEIQN